MIPKIDSDVLESELAKLRETELSREEVNKILHGLGEIIGIEDLALDEHGVVELTIDDTLEVSLIHLQNFPGIVVAIAMPKGSEESAAVLRKLLQVNMSWSLTQGGSFVYVPPQVALCRLIPLTSGDSARLDRELATFVALGKAWQAEIEACPIGDAPEDVSNDQSDEDVVGLRV